jgi:hypothetical protein
MTCTIVTISYIQVIYFLQSTIHIQGDSGQWRIQEFCSGGQQIQ